MDEIILVSPTKEFKEQILEYKKEFIDQGEYLAGTAGLGEASSFEEWYAALEDNSNEKTVRKGCVPASTYLGIRMKDQRLVGMLDIRHRLNDFLYKYGGHIGYSVRKSERRKGYAKEMLYLAIKKCKDLNIDKILITCDQSNIASAKTIQSNGGLLENEVTDQGSITQRYWIANITIRKATEKDKESIANVIAFAFEKDFSPLTKDMNRIAKTLEPGIQIDHFFVAEECREIIGVIACSDCTGRAVLTNKKDCIQNFGFIRGRIGSRIFANKFMKSLNYPKTTGYIEFVAVAKKAQRKGVASKMLNGIIKHTNYNEYMLDVTDVNVSAQVCYTKFGFVEVKRIKEKYASQKGFHEKIYMRYVK